MKSILNECVDRIKKNRKRYHKYLAVILVMGVLTTVGVNRALRQDGISMTQGAYFEEENGEESLTELDTAEEETPSELQEETTPEPTIEETPVPEETEESSEESSEVSENSKAEESENGESSEESSEAEPTPTPNPDEVSDDTADVETSENWEATIPTDLTGLWADDIVKVAKSQLGYKESEKNFTLSEDKTEKFGYTRYGEWYGDKYADWSAMFVSFCLNYTKVPTEKIPQNSDIQKWIDDLKARQIYNEASTQEDAYQPKTGDIVFLDNDKDDKVADHVGVISELIKETDENGNENLKSIKVIVGDDGGEVKEETYDLTDAKLLGYVEIPENPDYNENKYSDDTADVETSETWEKTLPTDLTDDWKANLVKVAQSQIGYKESTKNYRLSEDKTSHLGYTRYGDWYGNKYGEWSSMFASFCLSYAKVEGISTNSGAEAWIVSLESEGLYREVSEYEPVLGDLVFLDNDGDSLADHVGIVTAVTTDENNKLSTLKLIVGDSDDEVKEVTYEVSDSAIVGYAVTPQNPNLEDEYTSGKQTAKTDNYIVTVTYDADAKIPTDAKLKVTEYGTDTDEYKNACEEAGKTFDWVLDVSFMVGETEIEPSSIIQVSVTNKDTTAEVDEEAVTEVTHFAEDGIETKEGEDLEVAEDKKGRTKLSFELDSLSLLAGVTYHSATVSNYSTFKYGNNLLIYKVSGDYVYFLCSYSNSVAVMKVSLATLAKPGTDSLTASELTTIGNVFYAKDSISGTIITSSQTTNGNINWKQLVWYETGQAIQNKATGTYLNISQNALSLSSTYQAIYASQGNSSADTRLYAQNVAFTTTQWVQYSYWWGRYETTTTNKTAYIYFDSSSGLFKVTDTASTTCDLTLAVVGADKAGDEYVYGSTTAVYTGTTEDLGLGFYTVTVDDSGNVTAIPGVTYTIYDSNGNAKGVLTTTSDVRMDVSSLNLPNGDYTLKMTSVPSGYLLNQTTWKFTITSDTKALNLQPVDKNGENDGDATGIILVNPAGNLESDKTGSVVDYAKRIYQVELKAKSTLKQLSIDNITLNLVVDQSNSMLFPAGLNATDAYLTMRSGSSTILDIKNADTSTVYYAVTDAASTSTMYAIFYIDGKWYYQDASYYAKAIYGPHGQNDTSKITTSDTVYLPSEITTSDTSSPGTFHGSVNGKTVNGGAIGGSGNITKSKFASDVSAGTTTWTLYKATSEYNRLHYLEQAMSDMLQMLAEINPSATVTLDEFTKTVNPNNTCTTVQLNQTGLYYNGKSMTGLEYLQALVGNITTTGGTRQDLALEHVNNTHIKSGTKQYTVLITDGAPVLSSGTTPAVGTATDTANSSGTIYERINYQANVLKNTNGVTLITVGLGMQNVVSGSKSMKYISTNGPSTSTTVSGDHGQWWFQPEDAASIVDILTNQILSQITTASAQTNDNETVYDEISDSFYPVDSNGIQLPSGTLIDLDGNVISSTSITTTVTKYDSSQLTTAYRVNGTVYSSWQNWFQWYGYQTITGYWNGNTFVESTTGPAYTETVTTTVPHGTVYQREDGSWYVEWTGCDLSQSTAWSGKVYLKAKEDFIGGNAIATNKEAYLELQNGSEYSFESPTVNVHLLGMNELNSQVTVYKGDIINEEGSSPLDSVKKFFSETEFSKLVSGTGDVLNKVGESSNSELKADTFTLKYAIGRDLTDDEWNVLMNGGTITVPYTYNSTDGAVGEFTFSLNKTGNTANYDSHEATIAKGEGTAIEKYTLTVTYSAYQLGENDRPSTTVHNGSNGPGTEVGGDDAGTTLDTGVGTVTSNSTHTVYAIQGEIQIRKEIDDSMVDNSNDQTFEFTLYQQSSDGTWNTVGTSKTATVYAGQTKSGWISFTGLERGTYKVVETSGTEYVVENITVGSSTNCQSSGSGTTEVTFTMGNNTSGNNVISKSGSDDYTSYTDVPNGVLGVATVRNKRQVYYKDIPVKKVWSDSNIDHSGDAVYLVLYKDNTLATTTVDKDGESVTVAQVIKLDSSNNWQGTFSIPLTSSKDTDTPTHYSVRELKADSVVTTPDSSYTSDSYQMATLVNDNQIIYYPKTAVMEQDDENSNQTSFNGTCYQVYYENGTDEEAGTYTMTVTNAQAYELPKSGGSGTQPMMMGGILLLVGSLLSGFVLKRKQRRESN
jgi:LPXTG-motif cell wall-anchored protein